MTKPTKITRNLVCRRLDEMKVPPCMATDPLGQLLSTWISQGGRLIVREDPKGGIHIDYIPDASSGPGETPRWN